MLGPTKTNGSGEDITLARIKALTFSEKKILDVTGEFTLFKQLYNKSESFAPKDYRTKTDKRIFSVSLIGEGTSDYGGPYRDVITLISSELNSPSLDLFIKTPNNISEIGSYRDKYIVNPNANTTSHLEYFNFLGKMFGHAISSGNVLHINIHPIFWNLILNNPFNFSDVETIDKLFFKLITDIENITDINNLGFDLFYVTQSVSGAQVPLIENGANIQVTNENKQEFLSLSKNYRIKEIEEQIKAVQNGLL